MHPCLHSFVYGDEQPLTPTATPSSATAPSFGLFETPKTEPSIFDPPGLWSPATPHTSTPQHGTSQYLAASTPSQRPRSSSSQGKTHSGSGTIDAEIASHVHHLSPNPSLSLPPVEPSRQLTSSPIPSPTNGDGRARTNKSVYNTAEAEKERHHSQGGKSAGSMQTPPPTATSAAKRKAKQEQVANLVRASAAGSKIMASDFAQTRNGKDNDDPSRTSQKHFHQLQFSPDVFDYHPLSGPATAPAYPQHRLFWDPNTSTTSMDMDLGPSNSTYVLNPHQQGSSLDWAHSAVQTEKGHAGSSSTTMFHFGDNVGGSLQHSHTSSFNDTTFSVPQQPISQSFSGTSSQSQESLAVTLPFSGAVDPNVLTSFGGAPSHTIMAPPPSRVGNKSAFIVNGRRIPYQHQQQESRRERELEQARKSRIQKAENLQRSLNTGILEKAETLSTRPSIKRRATDTTLESSGNRYKKHAQSLPKPYKDGNNDENVAHSRRSRSAIMDHSNNRLGVGAGKVRKRTRTAVTLTIDSSGRAQTEIQSIPENTESGSDVDVIKGLDDDSDDESDSSVDSDGGHITSRNTSFSFPQQQPRRRRLGRANEGTLLQLEQSTTASSDLHCTPEATLNGYNLDMRLPFTKGQPRRVFQHQSAYGEEPDSHSKKNLPHEPESEAETVVDLDHEKGNAQHALRKLMKDRVRGEGKIPASPL